MPRKKPRRDREAKRQPALYALHGTSIAMLLSLNSLVCREERKWKVLSQRDACEKFLSVSRSLCIDVESKERACQVWEPLPATGLEEGTSSVGSCECWGQLRFDSPDISTIVNDCDAAATKREKISASPLRTPAVCASYKKTRIERLWLAVMSPLWSVLRVRLTLRLNAERRGPQEVIGDCSGSTRDRSDWRARQMR